VFCASISLLRSLFPPKPRSTCGRSELPKAQPASVSNASSAVTQEASLGRPVSGCSGRDGSVGHRQGWVGACGRGNRGFAPFLRQTGLRGCDPLASQDFDNAALLSSKRDPKVRAKLAGGLLAQRSIEPQTCSHSTSYGERWRWLYRWSGKTSIPVLDASTCSPSASR